MKYNSFLSDRDNFRRRMSCLPRFSSVTKAYLDSLEDNEETITIVYSKLTKYNNLSRFKQLKSLICSGSETSELPTLPDTIKTLRCNCNTIIKIQTLPSSLVNFDISYNSISKLPSLPNQLETLNCSFNEINYIPQLPSTIQRLDCSFNRLTYLPTHTTPQLNYLECSDNYIESLPPLSPALIYLYCGDNHLEKLPSLPNSIQRIDCSSNHIKYLPTLPKNLTYLLCYNNQLYYLPLLPPNLETIHFENNPMAEYFDAFNIELLRTQVSIVYKFRSTYYHLKFKQRFRNLLWSKREERARTLYSPENLKKMVDEIEDDDISLLFNVIEKW
jgi:Leucine-rich repeat (LRR) protein